MTVILFVCPWGPNALTENDIAGKFQKENGFIKGLKMSVVFVATIGVCKGDMVTKVFSEWFLVLFKNF